MLETEKRSGVKFCGGCQPEYDRMEARRQIEKQIGRKLIPVNAGEQFDEVYVICGCSVRCPDVSGILADRVVYVDSAETKPGGFE